MKKCQRCGEKNHEQDRYCRNCGAKLDVRPAAKLIENFKDRNIISRIIIVLVLLISTHAFAQIPVLLLTFGMAAILNKGTNYWMGTISFPSNLIGVVESIPTSSRHLM